MNIGFGWKGKIRCPVPTIVLKKNRVPEALGYIGEGFDDARLDTLFLALPVSWKGTLMQYAGRLHRLHTGKSQVHIYDYVDENVPMLVKMFLRRLRGYRVMGYETNDSIKMLLNCRYQA